MIGAVLKGAVDSSRVFAVLQTSIRIFPVLRACEPALCALWRCVETEIVRTRLVVGHYGQSDECAASSV